MKLLSAVGKSTVRKRARSAGLRGDCNFKPGGQGRPYWESNTWSRSRERWNSKPQRSLAEDCSSRGDNQCKNSSVWAKLTCMTGAKYMMERILIHEIHSPVNHYKDFGFYNE